MISHFNSDVSVVVVFKVDHLKCILPFTFWHSINTEAHLHHVKVCIFTQQTSWLLIFCERWN